MVSEEDLKIIVDEVLAAIKQRSKTIDQLAPVESFDATATIEINGGRKMKVSLIAKAVTEGYLVKFVNDKISLESNARIKADEALAGDIAKVKEEQSKYKGTLANKQDVLVSGVNIKSINGQSLLGSGNLFNVVNQYGKSEQDVMSQYAASKLFQSGMLICNSFNVSNFRSMQFSPEDAVKEFIRFVNSISVYVSPGCRLSYVNRATGRAETLVFVGPSNANKIESWKLDDMTIGNSSSDLEVVDKNGHVVLRVNGGHIQTKYFNSANIKSSGGITDADRNGIYYVRRNGTWTDVVPVIKDTVNNMHIGGGGGGIPDAPKDGTKYVRQNGNWVKETASSGGGGGIPEAPSDGSLYGRKNKGWAKIPTQSGVAEPMKTIKILSIGNSYSADAFAYVPIMMQAMYDNNIDITWTILLAAGASLADHKQSIDASSKRYEHYRYTKKDNKWIKSASTQSINDSLIENKWDIVTLQQNSGNSHKYETYQPTLNYIIDKIYSIATNNVKIAWLQTPAYAEGSKHLQPLGITSDEMFNKIAANSKKVLEDSLVDIVFPVGAAIQNARKTTLDQYGDFGHLSADQLHLQEGIPCQIAAYAVIHKLMDMIDTKRGVLGDKYLVQGKMWKAEYGIPNYNGEPVGSTIENLLIAQKCAIMACKHPNVITSNIK